MHKRLLSLFVSVLFVIASACQVSATNVSTTEQAQFDGSIILGRPTNNTITASILPKAETELYLSYGDKTGVYANKTSVITANSTVPAQFVMDKLSPNKTYYYVLNFKAKGASTFSQTKEYNFDTPKATGSSYNFVIQSDSHLLNKADKDLYTQSMNNMAKLNPDFMFDLGDTFLLDNGGTSTSTLTQEKANEIYRQQLPYFNIVTRNAPLFYGLGNHESEYGPLLDGTKNNVAAMSTIARTTYVPNPVPNDFYGGNTTKDPVFGFIQNYYSFTWGDALYVVIDPYRYGTNAASEDFKGDGWGWTLGKTQYDWFRKTLETSNAKYKFVFSHHAIGNIRGGANVATLYEWGGHDQKGNYIFDEKRPGWGKPIQQVMKDSNVTIFFQGHDHLFARENVDGVVYQTMPKPAEKIADNQNNIDAFTGDVMLNSGFLNVSVTSNGVQVDYNRNYLVASGEQTIGVVYSYTVDNSGKVTVLKNLKDNLTTYGQNEVTKNATTDKSTADKKATTQKQGGKNNSALASFVGVGATSAKVITPVPSGGYSFAIEADPHFDENTVDDYLNKTVSNIVSLKPSFLIDLGDASMVEKLGKTPVEAEKRNLLVKNYFAKFASISIKMVTGNHDVAINTQKPNYYTFTQGDAQFIILDPFAYSKETVGKGGGWATTLGKTQYDWFKNTLANSKSKYKFVFIHNLTGGLGKDSRGGVEAANFYEWGGNNENGVDEFAKMRPDFEMPIHDLLKKHGVDVVFHGHDHFYAKQEKDGIIYQLVPQPGSPGNSVNDAETYGYKSGVRLPSAGYLRVLVSRDKAVVEYLKTESDGSYIIPNVYEIKP